MALSTHPFQTLNPTFIMDAIESQGYRCDCRTLALNSYENRVYQVGIEEAQPLIAKFYRPGRWSDSQILEEHAFCFRTGRPRTAGGGSLQQHSRREPLPPRRLPLRPLSAPGRTRPGVRQPGQPADPWPVCWGGSIASGHSAVPAPSPSLTVRVSVMPASRYLLRISSPTSIGTATPSDRSVAGTIDRIVAEVPARTIRVHGDCHSRQYPLAGRGTPFRRFRRQLGWHRPFRICG